MLREVAPELWCVERRRRRLGSSSRERTSAVRLSSGELLLFYPPERPDEWIVALAKLGPIRYLLVPNLWGRLDLDAWHERYGPLTLLQPARPVGRTKPVSTSAAQHRTVTLVPERTGLRPVDDALAPEPVAGIPALEEWLFVHRPSRSLLVGDLVRGIEEGRAALGRLLDRLELGPGPLGTTRDVRWLVADRAALRAAVERIGGLPIDRVVPRVGAIVERDVRAALGRAFRWLDAPDAYWA